jgi:SAM-dependent methyltransferase
MQERPVPPSRLARWVRSSPQAKRVALLAMRCAAPFGRLHPGALGGFVRLLRERRRYQALGGQAPLLDLYPCLSDRTATTGFDAQYVYQAAWAAQRIAKASVASHVDIGSDIRFVGMLTAITPVLFVDIRPVRLDLPGFECRPGSLLALPFDDRSIASLSCLHVIEHVGLGRYGDPLDPEGAAKAAREITRVLATDGTTLVSVPVGRPRIQFNGQRVFSIDEVVRLFADLALVELSIVDGAGRLVIDVPPASPPLGEADSGNDFALGLFRFARKPDAH